MGRQSLSKPLYIKIRVWLVIIMMARSVLNIVLLLSFLTLVRPYSLQNIWKLRTSETSTLRTLSSPIYFQFSQELSADSQSTVGYLTITACNILTYNYQVVDAQLFLTFLSVGRSTRTCMNGQLAFLRGQLDETFYFYIMYSTLMLMPPNNDLPIKLDIHSLAKNPSISGIWIINTASNDSSIDTNVVINGSRIAFCGGSHVYGYKLANLVRINASEIKRNESCNKGILQNFNISAQAYRINNLLSPQTCTFYDKTGNQILALTYQSSFGTNLPIIPSSFGPRLPPPPNSNTNTKDNVNNINNTYVTLNNTNNTNNNKSSASPNNSNTQNSSSKTNSSSATSNQTNQVVNISQTSTTNNKSVPNTTNNTPPKNVTITQPAAPHNSNVSKSSPTSNNFSATTTTTPKPNSLNNNLTPPAQPSNLAYSIVNDPSSIFGIWYPSSSVLPGKLKPSDISVYQILINGGFIMLRGGCNTIVSPYSFASGSFTPTKLSMTANTCPANNDAILQGIIYNSSNTYYQTGSGSAQVLRIASSSNTTQLILTQNPPSS